jgi:hypothetical protein
MVLNGQVYLTEFCIVARYKDDKGHHIPETGLVFSGTLNFAPINAHQGRVTSRRDDLEMLGYSILFMLLGD